MATVRATDAELFYETIGIGRPLLMMHGGLGLDHTYLRAHDQLADLVRVIYYDHRGNGRSTRGTAADHPTWHADAVALLDHLGEDRAIVYGHSYGAFLALGFALAFPQRVSALILCGSAPAFDYAPEVVAEVQTGDPALAAAFLSLLGSPPERDADFALAFREIVPLYFHGAARPEILDRIRSSAEGFRAGNACLADYDVTTSLASLHVPVLLLAGLHDFITPPVQAHRIATATSRAEVIEFGASGHFPFIEEPASYFDALRGWLSRCTNQRDDDEQSVTPGP